MPQVIIAIGAHRERLELPNRIILRLRMASPYPRLPIGSPPLGTTTDTPSVDFT